MNTFPNTVSLDGEWDFFYDPVKFEYGKSNLPPEKVYTGRMVTPGYWDDHLELFDEEDFFGLTARFNPDYRKVHFPMGRSLTPHACSSFLVGSGYYRKTVRMDFKDTQKVFLRVGPAMWGCSVFCNGIPCGHETGYSTASEYDLTGKFLPGKENELVIAVCNVHDDGGAYHRVDKTHDGIPFGARPGQHRGLAAQGYQSERAGIAEGVSLRFTDGTDAIKDVFISYDGENLCWHVESTLDGEYELRWKIRSGKDVLQSAAENVSGSKVTFQSGKGSLHFWSDRNPVLYDVDLALYKEGVLCDSVTFRYGLRRVTTEGKKILLNGIPTYFRGVTEHCYFPESCNPHWDKEKYLRDLGVLRNAGFNFIRCHTWCPPEAFYDACDELGFLVQTEQPSVYTFEESKAILRLIRRHPCAVIFCEGNEKQIIDEELERMRDLVKIVREMAPGMLFNPQEAIRGVEYEFMPGRKITFEPIPHDAERLAQIAEFSDVYGSLGGYFSYENDAFPGVKTVEYYHTTYTRPCLSHEAGILGGYLDFSLEKRYEDTYIGTDLFREARRNMKKHGVYQYAGEYYEKNCLFISSLRKQLIENMRSCPSISGYDYLGGIDTHWHLVGYPCGVFNEFYEEKYGETVADVYRYTRENVLLCSALSNRRRLENSSFREEILLSYYGEKSEMSGTLHCTLSLSCGKTAWEKEYSFGPVKAGSVSAIGITDFTFPAFGKPYCCTLHCTALLENGERVENHWKIWVFPAVEDKVPCGVRISSALTEEDLDFAAAGGALLLTGSFPAVALKENYRPHTSGRSMGHAGMLLHAHPVLKEFPNEGFGDWQFFPMMSGSHSLVYDKQMPSFEDSTILELIPSFKMVKRKSMLSEFQVGHGRILMTGLVFDPEDPAGMYFKNALLTYLERGEYAPAPEWSVADLKKRLVTPPAEKRTVSVRIDEGGRPVYD
ncbi:MAG: hypothetical protein J6S58_04930 [Lentisphaeria bacterium]|nr:hypothetical protein [Lentisphaeria bacterium]